MNAPHLALDRPLSRRTFLRGAGVALSLPWLDAMVPSFAWARPAEAVAAGTSGEKPRRLLAILTNMGILGANFFPEQPGRDYVLSPYLEELKEFRSDFTVFSGVSHPETAGAGHAADVTFLTAAPHPGRSGFRNSISVDQFAAERIGRLTRFPSLPLMVGTGGGSSLSITANGVPIPPDAQPSKVFTRLFVQGTPDEVAVQVSRLRQGRSILDVVAGRARVLQNGLGAADREKLDQYFTSVRELEQGLEAAEDWEHRPKPPVTEPAPQDIANPADVINRTRLMYRVARLALQTDSTRLVTLFIADDHNPVIPLEGVSEGHHTLTHHGNQPESLEQLRTIETAQFRALAELLGGLKAMPEDGESLLDRTLVFYGAAMGNANAHSNENLPVLLAGGGFRHGQHLGFDRERNYPLPNLFVSLLQRLGIPADRFSSSTGTMRGLEMV